MKGFALSSGKSWNPRDLRNDAYFKEHLDAAEEVDRCSNLTLKVNTDIICRYM